MLTLYDSKLSGNGWKVRILLNLLGRTYERKVLDLGAGQARTPEFLKLNPWARVPVLVLEDGTALAESNAILMFLARGTPWLPDDPVQQALVVKWLFFEQADHLRFFARPRFLVALAGLGEQCADEVAYLREIGARALPALQAQLASTPFIAGDNCTIADIALFPYTSMAGMGGYDLQPYPAILAWIDRMRALPGFIELIPPQA